jgi:hypothetical protein
MSVLMRSPELTFSWGLSQRQPVGFFHRCLPVGAEVDAFASMGHVVLTGVLVERNWV